MNEADQCAAFGCPLFGVHGVGGKWYCACHFNANPALNDAITLEICRRKQLVDRILLLRHEHHPDAVAENELLNAVRGVVAPSGGVIGPTGAQPHFSETDA
jgi:hypothetical protein